MRKWLALIALLCVMWGVCMACSDSTAQDVASSSTPTMVQQPKATATGKAQATPRPKPAPTATPNMTGIGYHMVIGEGHATNSTDCCLASQKDTFTSSDQFGFAVVLDHAFGVSHVGMSVLQEMPDRTTVTKLAITLTIDPTDKTIGNQYPMSTMMQDDPPGKYKLEFTTETALLAWAEFTYLG